MRTRLILVAVVILSAVACERKGKENTSAETVVQPPVNDLPTMPIALLDGTTVNARELKGKNILILFQPDCDHCQHEATQIQANLEAFKKHTLYFVSSASHQEIEKFSSDYKLKGEPNIFFGMTASENVINNFGPIQAPAVYIYADQKLIQDFNGQVDISVIVKYL